ncbi:MAG: adenosylhomocysteinase [Candidatus Methanofastidiosia archaeon]
MNDIVESGNRKIDWVENNMPVVAIIRKRFKKEKPFNGFSVSCCLHLEAKTAFTAIVLKEGGADVAICGSNPLTTQDDVAKALKRRGVNVFARYGQSQEEYYENLNRTLDIRPEVIIDDGADLASLVHRERRELLDGICGLCEETTTGVIRLNAMEKDGTLSFPAVAVNNAKCKYLFDNRYGTGQSTLDGIMRTTNLVVAGKNFVVAGYGWCGKGIAMRARGMGAKVIVAEVNPIRAIEAHMDGFEVMKMEQACSIGDIFVTATGCKNVIVKRHFEKMKSGAILANAGHFNVEIDVSGLEEVANNKKESRRNITSYQIGNRWLHLLGEGRLVNLACADGHPVEIMDMSFSLQLLSAEFVTKNPLENKVYPVPEAIDRAVARMKLEADNIEIDTLDDSQKKYLNAWNQGT